MLHALLPSCVPPWRASPHVLTAVALLFRIGISLPSEANPQPNSKPPDICSKNPSDIGNLEIEGGDGILNFVRRICVRIVGKGRGQLGPP